MQQLLDDVALRIPSRRLLDHSLTAAVDELHNRHDKAAA
jgi:hypothetical protein